MESTLLVIQEVTIRCLISIIAKIICGIILGSIAVKFSNALEEVVKAAICVEYVYDKDNNEWIPYKEENRI